MLRCSATLNSSESLNSKALGYCHIICTKITRNNRALYFTKRLRPDVHNPGTGGRWAIVHEAGEGGLVAAGTYVQMRATPSQSVPIDQILQITVVLPSFTRGEIDCS